MKTYTEDFKRAAVRLVLEENYTMEEAGRNLGGSPTTSTIYVSE